MIKEYRDFLAHYGVKGQKWGVRNYQNPDGTLIHPKGKKKKEVPESDTWKKNEAKYLSDDELNRRNNRLQREAQYRQNLENRHPVKKETKAILKKLFVTAAVGALAAVIGGQYKKIMDKGANFIKRKQASIMAANALGNAVNSSKVNMPWRPNSVNIRRGESPWASNATSIRRKG